MIPKTIDFETTLASALDDIGPLIALGKPGEHFGAGRLESSESDWHNKAKQLMDHARLCFIVPSHSTGTAWELDYIVSQQLLIKCCFFLPSVSDLASAVDMDNTRLAMAVRGLNMPVQSNNPTLYTLSHNGDVDNMLHIPVLSARLLREALDRVLLGRGWRTRDGSDPPLS